jgi:hypothetical protein
MFKGLGDCILVDKGLTGKVTAGRDFSGLPTVFFIILIPKG